VKHSSVLILRRAEFHTAGAVTEVYNIIQNFMPKKLTSTKISLVSVQHQSLLTVTAVDTFSLTTPWSQPSSGSLHWLCTQLLLRPSLNVSNQQGTVIDSCQSNHRQSNYWLSGLKGITGRLVIDLLVGGNTLKMYVCHYRNCQTTLACGFTTVYLVSQLEYTNFNLSTSV